MTAATATQGVTLALLLIAAPAFADREAVPNMPVDPAFTSPCKDSLEAKLCQQVAALAQHEVDLAKLTVEVARLAARVEACEGRSECGSPALEEELRRQGAALQRHEESLEALKDEIELVKAQRDSLQTPLSVCWLRCDGPAKWTFGTDHLFGLTRGVAGSTSTNPMRGFWFLLSVPVDLAFLPIGLLGGLAGAG